MKDRDVKKTDDTNHFEDIELEEIEENAKATIKQLKKKLKTSEAEKAATLEEVQRTKADFLNSKRRLQEQATRDVERAKNQVLESLLPLADSFEMAMKDKDLWETCDEKWRKGIEAIYNNLLSIFTTHGVEKIGKAGERFNPNRHEAVSTAESDVESDHVIEVLQSGYVKNDELIRPAKVIISN